MTASDGGVPQQGARQNSDFRRLWTAASVSLFGTQVTELALPLTAVLSLQATPLQMGLLGAAGQSPFLLFSLLAGVWVDHIRKRRLLIWTDLLRAALLVSVPLAAWTLVHGRHAPGPFRYFSTALRLSKDTPTFFISVAVAVGMATIR